MKVWHEKQALGPHKWTDVLGAAGSSQPESKILKLGGDTHL